MLGIQDKTVKFGRALGVSTEQATLLKKQFPEKVKKKNLYFFINHNFKNIFPNYDIQINTKKNIVIILNNNNSIVLQSIIIP